MQVNKMDIRIKADAFTATTFIEMEFYNPTNTEMEGLYNFELQPGQAITAFQLDLFGKFRDGSIEEKWKARNAYNTIVGKRVDPALLQMDYYNHYSLRIYPVPAMGSRRITMTIQQLLVVENGAAVYKLPLVITDLIGQLNVNIAVAGCEASPTVIQGLLTNQSFANDKNCHYELVWSASGIKADKPLSFSIPVQLKQPILCIKNMDGKSFFALRIKPAVQRSYTIHPKKVSVFWDISASGSSRNVSKEIAFLKQYVFANKISQLTIISFNQRIQDTAIFYTDNNFDSHWVEYLRSLQYEGATQLGSLDFSNANADAILLFSDGRNSIGKNLPVPGGIHVYCISTAVYPDLPQLERVIGQTGGRFIDLNALATTEAVERASQAENILLNLSVAGNKLHINQKLSELKEDTLLLTGIIPAGEHNITLSYGNNGKIQAEEKIEISNNSSCSESAIERIDMLSVFDSYAKNNSYWMDVINFGKQEKVVTQSTSFIVLEKIADYVRFNILPPKELEAQCDMNIFVKADEARRKQYRKRNEFEELSEVANAYNERITWWDKKEPVISLTEEKIEQVIADENKKENEAAKTSVTGPSDKLVVQDFPAGAKVSMGTEVVVTAMGQTRQPRELGYSVSVVRSAELTQAKAVNMQNALTGKVSGLNVQSVNNGVFNDTRMTLRGIRSLTGNNQPMIVFDGVPMELRFLSQINPNDIRDVTILKGSSATAIYGPDGVNGALIITTKKGSRNSYYYYWSKYKLKDCDDVDYLSDLKAVPYGDKLSKYNELKNIYKADAGFYFDVAQHFFESGYRKEALAILYSAADITNGSRQTLVAIGYTLETWKEFDEAIALYTEMLSENENDLKTYRNLALTFYQKGNYQEAINILYKGIEKENENYEYSNKTLKAMMLQEMNAIVAVHKDGLDLSKINQQFIRPLAVDLRVTFDCNTRDLYSSVLIAEPDGTVCSFSKPESASGGRLTQNNYYYNGRYMYTDIPEEYQVKNARTGKYKLRISYSGYGGYYYDVKVPTMIKIMTFRNFGKANQAIEVENVIMDNQYGEVEIGEIKW
jgi:TonB-dependent SusC/RagA subfamily outer membrane receptor